jgi:hypothetical protein
VDTTVLFIQFHVGGLESKATSGGHGVPSIHGQVHEHLLELMYVNLGVTQVGAL